MSRTYISDLQPGCQIDQIFLITQKDLRSSSNGSLYIHAVLADRTGDMPARMWQANEAIYRAMPEAGYARLTGRTDSYKGNLQFIIEALRPIDTSEVDPAEFLPHTDNNIDEMYNRVVEILRTIQNKHLLQLVKQYITDEELMARFRQAPAATSMHHAYIGGLLEHTRNILELVLLVAPRYPQVNMDVLLVGTFLHDLGKTFELKWDCAFQYSEPGELVGHLVEGAAWVRERAQKVEQEMGEPFPKRLLWSVQHIIVAHHGQYDYGSPKLPMSTEALMMHYLDNIDAKMQMCDAEIHASRNQDSAFTGYVRALESRIYRANLLEDPE